MTDLALVNRFNGPTETSYTTNTHLPDDTRVPIRRPIDSVLPEPSAISRAGIALHEDFAEEKWPGAYLVGSNDGSADTIQSKLHWSLRMQLPEHMILSAYVFRTSLRTSPKGQTDWKALPVRSLHQISTVTAERKRRARGAFGIDFPVSNLFQCPTIESLALAIEDYESTLYGDDKLLHTLDEIDAVRSAERGE